MKINEIIEEMIGDSANIRTYSAYETPARKDFIPLNKSDYSFSYQQNVQDGGTKLPSPPIKGTLPWPLETVVDDFADSYVYLYTIGQKINKAIVNNKALSKKQKNLLKKYLKDITIMMQHIKLLGSKIIDISKIN
jgi:hypothetical protein